MTDQDDDGGRKDNEIDVEAVEGDEYGPDNRPPIPDQLRMLADRLDGDDDTQLIVGVVGVDLRGNDTGPAVYNFHLTSDAFDGLTAEQTMKVVDLFNESSVDNGFKIGLRDALAGPLSDMPKPTAVGSVSLADVMGAGGGPGGESDGLDDLLGSLFGSDDDDR